MPNKPTGERRTRFPKTITVTVSGNYENARWCEGDRPPHTWYEVTGRVQVQKGAPYKDGDIVAYECPRCPIGTYHARFYQKINGKIFSHRLAVYKDGRREQFRDGEVEIIGPVILTSKTSAKEEAEAKGQPKTQTYIAGFDWSFFGVHKGDTLTVAKGAPIKPGQLVLVKYDDAQDDGDSFFNRVCLVGQETVRIVGDDSGEEAHEKQLSLVIGPTVKVECGEMCVRRKATALRERLASLGDDITDSTEAFKIEREIYALEHPKDEETDDDAEDWPEVIGEGGNE